MFAFVFGLTFVFNLALNNLLPEGCACTEQDDVFSVLLWYFDYDLHCVLLAVYVLIIQPKDQSVKSQCCKKATQSGRSIQAMQPVALRQGVAVAGPSVPDR